MTRLTIAIPSKGRLKDNSEAWLSACGFRLRQKGGTRGYQAEIDGLDADVMLLSAREIALGLIAGDLHVGITGEDLLHDLSPDIDKDVATIKPLGFGRADVIVALPKAWLDVATMADLEAAAALFRQRHGRRLRVATKYLALTRRFFADRSVGGYRLVESAGATEAAPASGAADVIVDITSTGATLEANGLKVLSDGVILRSQAVLAGGLKSEWSDAAKATLSTLLDAAEARDEASGAQLLTTAKPIPDGVLSELGLIRIAENQAQCTMSQTRGAAQVLASSGLGPVSVHNLEFVFQGENAATANFLAKI